MGKRSSNPSGDESDYTPKEKADADQRQAAMEKVIKDEKAASEEE